MDDNEIKVFISHRESKCEECGEELGRQAWITLDDVVRERKSAIELKPRWTCGVHKADFVRRVAFPQ